jgi:hypothetical protein
MVICPKCGKEIEEKSNFCKFCGSEISLVSETASSPSELRKIIEKRLNAIKTHDEGILGDIMEKSLYTKFDDWPPFTRQDSTEALENEKGAYKVMQRYNYEIKDYKEYILSSTALATFHIHYSGTIRNRDFDVNSRVTIVLRESDQSWSVIHEHWSRFPDEKQRRGLFG